MRIRLTDKIMNDDHDDVAAAAIVYDEEERSNFSVINVMR